MKSVALVGLWSLVLAWSTVAHAADSPVFFRASMDGKSAAELNGNSLSPVRETNPVWFEGTALSVTKGTQLEYVLGDGFPTHAGAIEIRFKPGFPQQPDQAKRTLFTLLDADGQGIDFGFVPDGTRWEFGMRFPDWKRKVTAWYFDKGNEERWNHFVLTWDDKASPKPVLRFYRDGKWERARTEAYSRLFTGLKKLVIGGDGDLQTNIDEIVIYREALSASDVAVLHDSFGRADRVAILQQKRAEATRLAKAAADTRKALVAQLKGKVACIVSPKGSEQRDFRLPGGIVATGLRVEDIDKTDLSRFTVIYGPPGGAYQTTKSQDDLLRRYVQEGGGYVGVCAGAFYAGKTHLLNMTTHSLKNQGLVSVGVQPHPVTEGFSGEVVIHHGNGPIMIPGEGCQVVGSFLFGQNFPVVTAAIVAGASGKGRVVAFGPHPTGGGVVFESKGTQFSGSELGTDKLLVNALLWAARVTDTDAEPVAAPAKDGAIERPETAILK